VGVLRLRPHPRRREGGGGRARGARRGGRGRRPGTAFGGSRVGGARETRGRLPASLLRGAAGPDGPERRVHARRHHIVARGRRGRRRSVASGLGDMGRARTGRPRRVCSVGALPRSSPQGAVAQMFRSCLSDHIISEMPERRFDVVG
jgi:hypothetical protein